MSFLQGEWLPSAVTQGAMEEADTNKLPRFGSVQELFDDIGKHGERPNKPICLRNRQPLNALVLRLSVKRSKCTTQLAREALPMLNIGSTPSHHD
jgi:hypothetical protein